MLRLHSTTILAVRHRGAVALGGDGQVTLGSVVFKSDEATGLFKFDTSVTGNGNGGHSGKEFGTDMREDDRTALLEYLKSVR